MEMAADGFTKPLPKKVFKRFMNQIGMILKGRGSTEEKSEEASS